jgi:hypothetical protein
MAKVAIFDHPQEKEGQKTVLLVSRKNRHGKLTYFGWLVKNLLGGRRRESIHALQQRHLLRPRAGGVRGKGELESEGLGRQGFANNVIFWCILSDKLSQTIWALQEKRAWQKTLSAVCSAPHRIKWAAKSPHC